MIGKDASPDPHGLGNLSQVSVQEKMFRWQDFNSQTVVGAYPDAIILTKKLVRAYRTII